MLRRLLIIMAALISSSVLAGGVTTATGQIGKTHKTPTWMKEGMVIAGDWATYMARKQEIGASWTQDGYKLTNDEAEAAMKKEFSPWMADELKKRGVTFVMMPLFSGLGSYAEEKKHMETTKAFAEMCHERGMRVGVYIHQGQISREFQQAMPESREWLAWPSPKGNFKNLPPPLTKEEGQPVYRNHPGYQKFMQGVIKYAVEEVKVDFIHHDNYVYPSGWSPSAQEDFKKYLHAKYKSSELKKLFGDDKLDNVVADAFAKKSPAAQEWNMFQGWMFAESFRQLTEYTRSLNPQVATELNASGVTYHGYRRYIDLPLAITNGDAFWDEQAALGWDAKNNKLNTSIRSYKLARNFDQKALTYTSIRLARDESLAFNNDSLGCLYWFMYGRINWPVTTNDTAATEELAETKFYNANRELYNNGTMIADVAVYRGRDQAFNGPMNAIFNTSMFEQAMITGHIPFTWITDQHLDKLSVYRVVVLADVTMMRDENIKKVLKYVEKGGNLIVTGKTASLDPWGKPREGWEKIFTPGKHGKGMIVQAEIKQPEKIEEGSLPLNIDELKQTVVSAMGEPSVIVDAPVYVGTEFVKQKGRLIVHVLDYSQSNVNQTITITVPSSLGKVTGAKAFSPTQEAKTLSIEDSNKILVPWPDVYAAVVIDLK